MVNKMSLIPLESARAHVWIRNKTSTSLESERTKKRAWAGCARSFGLVCSADTQALDFVTTRA
jgi:hypothetical protein